MMQVYCSQCDRELKAIGNVHDDIMNRGGKIVGGSRAGWDQWHGTVCPHCEVIFCNNCRSTSPGPCRICNNNVKPAALFYLPKHRSKIYEYGGVLTEEEAKVKVTGRCTSANIIGLKVIHAAHTGLLISHYDSDAKVAESGVRGKVPSWASKTTFKIHDRKTGSFEVQASNEDYALQAAQNKKRGLGANDIPFGEVRFKVSTIKQPFSLSGIAKWLLGRVWLVDWELPFCANILCEGNTTFIIVQLRE